MQSRRTRYQSESELGMEMNLQQLFALDLAWDLNKWYTMYVAMISYLFASVYLSLSQWLLSLYPVGAAWAQWKIGGDFFLNEGFYWDSLQCNIQSRLPLIIITYFGALFIYFF